MENTQIGPFLVIRKLGSHRRHNVYLARQVEQNRDVALKFISLPPDVERDKALAKINHEVKMLRHLSHKNLVQLYGAGVHEDKVFFAHELVEGETVSALLSRRNRLAPDLVVDYGRQIAQLLEYLHQNEIIHSKLTTDKIIIQADGTVKVSDLRLNRSRKRRWDAARRAQLEIAAYLAPEQLLENGATSKSDLYSLGVILFEMLTGRLPFEPETMAQLARAKQEDRAPSVTSRVMNCPGWLDGLTASLLEPDVRRRPHSARAVVMALEEIRSIDQGKKTAVEEMSRGFTALTAGSDKSEARRLMGIKKEKKPKGPLLESIPFLLAGLFAVAVLFAAFAFWPTNRTSMMDRASALMESENPRDWQRARSIYKRLMKSSSDPALAAQAEDQYFKSRKQALMHRMNIGLVGLEKPEVRKFYLAYHNREEGRLDEALARFKNLIDNVDPEGDQRHIYEEAKRNFDELTADSDEAKTLRGDIESQMGEAEKKMANGEQDKAVEIYKSVVDQCGDNSFLKLFAVQAQAQLVNLGATADKEKAPVVNESVQEQQEIPKQKDGESSGESENRQASPDDSVSLYGVSAFLCSK